MPSGKFGVCAAVIVLLFLDPSVAFAWGVGGGGVNIPGFGALWREPNRPGFSQDLEKGLDGRPVSRESRKAKKKGWHGANVPPR